jgi:hypothetical protein
MMMTSGRVLLVLPHTVSSSCTALPMSDTISVNESWVRMRHAYLVHSLQVEGKFACARLSR